MIFLVLSEQFLIDPSLIYIAHKLVTFDLSLLQLLKLLVCNPLSDVAKNGFIDVVQTNSALIYDLRKIMKKKALPYLFINPVYLQEIAGH